MHTLKVSEYTMWSFLLHIEVFHFTEKLIYNCIEESFIYAIKKKKKWFIKSELLH